MALTSFAQSIRDGLAVAMAADPAVICFGLGADDPKGVFGTTLDLHKQFGSDRVFDMPTSESAMTGIAIGAALNGLKPVLTHQRLDFALLSMDQLVNNAAKWRFMFGGRRSVPITIRMIIGRGWGQGPTHSQSLQAWFAHIPGLKVVMPTTAEDAKGLLLSSIFDPDPVIFLEHRWLHN
ncbi:MAG: alpha-ketoacid dehydrogenase subunit beta, partial [Rhizomicrobium sp.]